MTALTDYAKLEAEAVFHDAASGLASEVVLSFGERSLIIMSLDDRPIAHWPLVTLHGRGAEPDGTTEIAPDRLAEDYITLTDAEMISAIRAVCPNLYDAPAKQPVPRRTKWRVAIVMALILAVAALISAPFAIREIVNDISVTQEGRLGLAMHPLVVAKLQGGNARVWECTAPEGDAALSAITDRLIPETPQSPRVSVLDLPTPGTLVLPGGDILIFRGILDRAESPEALAGLLAHQFAHDASRAPLKHTIAHFGIIDLLKLWWGAEPEEEVLETATAAFLALPYDQKIEESADTASLSTLTAAGLPSRAYAANLAAWVDPGNDPLSFLVRHPSPDRTRTAEAADRIGDAAFRPALDDRSWLALANICDERAPFD